MEFLIALVALVVVLGVLMFVGRKLFGKKEAGSVSPLGRAIGADARQPFDSTNGSGSGNIPGPGSP